MESSTEGEDFHILFQNDDYASAVVNAVWFGKKMPSKRAVLMESRQVSTRRGTGAVP